MPTIPDLQETAYRRRTERPRAGVLVSVFAVVAVFTGIEEARSQTAAAIGQTIPVPRQPLAAQAARLAQALDYVGARLSDPDRQALATAAEALDETQSTRAIQDVLDRSTLFEVHLGAASGVRVTAGAARPELDQHGWRTFLVKVYNQAGLTAALEVTSPQGKPVATRGGSRQDGTGGWTAGQRARRRLGPEDVKDRWLDIALFDKPPLAPTLSGLAIEYRIVQLYSRDAGQREATISFSVGQGNQNSGFPGSLPVLFHCQPARDVVLRVLDEDGRPTTASFVIRDSYGHVYPSPAKRLAPDFPFQKQVYRADGERLTLPVGAYDVEFTRGPEYIPQHQRLVVREAARGTSFDIGDQRSRQGNGQTDNVEGATFRLRRWVNMPRLGWYSSDHHVHASGCAHYEAPVEGVLPQDVMRHALGEALNIAVSLIWGPSYYYQRQFFKGRDDYVSAPNHLVHYDLEISEFPSSHAGHLVLLNLGDQDYPGTKVIEDWPTWNGPILRWAKTQGAVVGYAHSGSGLEVKSTTIPSLELPKFDGVGANEYIVDVTNDLVDFISVMDTAPAAELNIWYHTLNAGFRTRISGESDFPCIFGERVGVGRSYVHLGEFVTYQRWVDAIRDGRSYVTDGKSHLVDFRLNDQLVGTRGSELRLDEPGRVRITARVAARLELMPRSPVPRLLLHDQPRWDLEQARLGNSLNVPLELIVNGQVVDSRPLVADGTLRDVAFDLSMARSGWVALRILPSSHTNPIFVIVDGKPIRASRESIEWCLRGVDRCWNQKFGQISAAERPAAQEAFEHARAVYRQLLEEVDSQSRSR